MANTVKVLFSGAPEGAAQEMMKKVEAANKKVGAAALFCVGQFFGPGDHAADPDDWLVSVVTGDIAVPVPTYFIGGYGAGSSAILDALPASEAKLRYLGRAGVARVAGLTVAYLDGVFNGVAYNSLPSSAEEMSRSPYYTSRDVQALKDALEQLEGEVDVLLTCEWPRGITSGVPEGQLPPGIHTDDITGPGPAVIAEIAALARPRYHFAGGPDCHFARLPYTNKDLGAGPRASRFVALAHVQNTNKAKSLHALALVPAIEMDPESLSAIPDGSTPCPFPDPHDNKRGQKRHFEDQALPDGQSWRWSMRGRGGRGRGPGGRFGDGGDRGGPGGPGGRGGGQGGVFREPPAPIRGRTDIVRDPYATIIARNMPWHATEADIIHLFSQAGKVVDVVRGATADGKVHGWLTVQFDSKEAAGKALQLEGSDFMGRTIHIEPATSSGRKPAGPPGQAVDGCWFCLGSANVDVELVASVGDEAYLAVDKGAINDSHVLIVSVDHYPSSAGMPPSTYTEVDRYLSALRSYYASQGRDMVAFERYLVLKKSGGNHCHINAIGIPRTPAKEVEDAFQQAAQRAGYHMTPVQEGGEGAGGPIGRQVALQGAVGQCEYFMAILPDGKRLVRPIMRDERWPMNLGREVLAKLAGCPERADWKACSVSREEEEARTERFKAAFKAYDPTLA